MIDLAQAWQFCYSRLQIYSEGYQKYRHYNQYAYLGFMEYLTGEFLRIDMPEINEYLAWKKESFKKYEQEN